MYFSLVSKYWIRVVFAKTRNSKVHHPVHKIGPVLLHSIKVSVVYPLLQLAEIYKHISENCPLIRSVRLLVSGN